MCSWGSNYWIVYDIRIQKNSPHSSKEPRCRIKSRRFLSLVNRTIIINAQYFHDFIRYPILKRIYQLSIAKITDEVMKILNIYNNSSIDETLKLSRLKALSGIPVKMWKSVMMMKVMMLTAFNLIMRQNELLITASRLPQCNDFRALYIEAHGHWVEVGGIVLVVVPIPHIYAQIHPLSEGRVVHRVVVVRTYRGREMWNQRKPDMHVELMLMGVD